MARYFFSKEGVYLGAFDAGALPEDAQAEWYSAHIPKGAIEVDEPPAHGFDKLNVKTGKIIPYVAPADIAAGLNSEFEVLNEDLQADLAPLKAAVKLELEQGRPHIAKKIIERAQIPDALIPVRDAMLAHFPEA